MLAIWRGSGFVWAIVILVFFSIIAAINYYLYYTVVSAYSNYGEISGIVLILLVASLFIAVGLEKKGFLRASIPFSWIGYSWVGIMGIALFFAAVFDAVQVLLPRLSDIDTFHGVVLLTVAASIYSFVSARRIRVNRIEIISDKLPDIDRPIVLVQISDMHLGDSSTLSRTRKIVDAVNRLKPDIVVSTGDLFDGFLSMMGPYVEILKSIESGNGKYAVSGNHEVYAGLEEGMKLTEAAGFENLRNRATQADLGIAVVGLEDPAAPEQVNEQDLLESVPVEQFRLLLKHRPDIDRKSVGKFDLQLSGHTHGGQIFPFHLLTKMQYRVSPGLTAIAEKQWLYLSRGTGAWGPQMRFLAPPEITRFELRRP